MGAQKRPFLAKEPQKDPQGGPKKRKWRWFFLGLGLKDPFWHVGAPKRPFLAFWAPKRPFLAKGPQKDPPIPVIPFEPSYQN